MNRPDAIEAAAQEVWRSESVNRRKGLIWPDDLSVTLVQGYRTAAVNILHMSAFISENEHDKDLMTGVLSVWSRWMNDELTHKHAMEEIAGLIGACKGEL